MLRKKNLATKLHEETRRKKMCAIYGKVLPETQEMPQKGTKTHKGMFFTAPGIKIAKKGL
jgi:hypothetical protein